MGLKDVALTNYATAHGADAFEKLKEAVTAAIKSQSQTGEARLQFTVRDDPTTRRVLAWLNESEGIPAHYRDGMIVWEWARAQT